MKYGNYTHVYIISCYRPRYVYWRGMRLSSMVQRLEGVGMEPALIEYLATLGYGITHVLHDCYECYNMDGSGMTEEQMQHMQQATQKWLINRYYH